MHCSAVQCNAMQYNDCISFYLQVPFHFSFFFSFFQSHAGLSYATCPPVLSCPVLSCLFRSITFHVSMYCMYPS